MTRTASWRRRFRRIGVLGSAAILALGACSATGPESSSATDGEGPGGTVTVFAAASLKEGFTELGQRFEEDHPGTRVTFNFSGSDALAAGIVNGAPADVFAAAGTETMRLVTDQGLTAGSPSTFVRNRLEIATAPGNPHGIDSLRDLTAPGLKVVLCDRTVPCGAAARTALTAGGIELTPASYERDVKSALTKVQLNEADAALVYRTDIQAAGDRVEGVAFPESIEAVNDYPIARLDNAPNPAAAKAFIDLVTSPEGRKSLGAAGFLEP